MESYSVEALLSAKDNGFTSTMNSAVKDLSNLDSGSKTATKSVASMAVGFGAVKVASKVFSVMAGSMDAAISRFDTMQRFPKVMESFGYSAEESTANVNKLSEGIQGLPTKLDDVVNTAQRMTAMTGNLGKSTDATLALNNAFLASGSSASDASRGTDQYLQMLAKGEVDLQSWRSLQESMSTGLQMVAKEMGYTGEAATTDLYAALKSGDVTFREFQNQLIDLGTGTGTLADLARKNSEGIGTSFQNLGNAVTVGVAGVIDSFDNLSEEVTGKTIAQNLDGLKATVKTTFSAVNKSIEATAPVIELVGDGIGVLKSNADTLVPALAGVTAGFGAWKSISSINSIISKTDSLMIAAGLSGEALTATTQKHIAAQIGDTAAGKAKVAALAAENGVISLSTLLLAVRTGALEKQTAATALMATMTGTSTAAVKIQAAAVGLASGALSVGTVATWAATAATTAFSTALKVITGPIGWVVGGISALVAGGTALFKWLNKETEASKKLNKEQSALADSTKTLTDSTDSNIKRREEELSTIETNSAAYQDLGDQIVDLASKEKLTREEKKLLTDSVDQLNGSVAGLNLQYDEEGKMLSMTAEQMKARIEAYKDQETANQAQEDLLNILKEQHSVEAKLKETSALREEWNQKLVDGAVKAKEHKEAIGELDAQEKTLKGTLNELGEQQKQTQAIQEEANAAVAEATENGTMRQVLSLGTLSDEVRATVDGMKSKWQEYQDAATNMFDTLTDKQEMSVGEMQANLEENQRVISTWADNIATLANRGVDEGLLAKLRDAGPESAGYVAAMVSASDSELQNLSSTYAKGGETATNAFKTAWDTGAQGIDEKITSMVFSAETSLDTAIKTTNWKALGEQVPKGAAEGVKSGSKDVADAAGEMAKGTDDAFAKEADIHSPSRVFHEHGINVAKGAEEGIKEGESAVVRTITQLAAKLPIEMNSLPSEMRNSGSNAMQGLADGINGSAYLAINAANSVASQVAATINSALDIHSPSRVTRESGENTSDGLALGMMDRIRNVVSSARKVAQTAAENLQIRSQQRYDLSLAGGGIMRYQPPTLQTQKEVPPITVNVSPELPPINVNVVSELDGKKVSKELAEPLSYELNKRYQNASFKNGRRPL